MEGPVRLASGLVDAAMSDALPPLCDDIAAEAERAFGRHGTSRVRRGMCGCGSSGLHDGGEQVRVVGTHELEEHAQLHRPDDLCVHRDSDLKAHSAAWRVEPSRRSHGRGIEAKLSWGKFELGPAHARRGPSGLLPHGKNFGPGRPYFDANGSVRPHTI